MTSETLFFLSYAIVLPGWLLLIFAPRWKWSARLVSAVIIPILLTIIYVYLIVANAGNEGGFFSLDEVYLLFQNRNIVLLGWIHYLVFDLFIACWEVRDSQRLGISHLLVVPCLIMTCLYGPIGFVLYLILRFLNKEFFIDEPAK